MILETHSESILLRVRRLIRSGKLAPDDVAVLYVDNDPDAGTSVDEFASASRANCLTRGRPGSSTTVSDVLGGWA